jgi:hypothetical protein
LSLTRDRNDDVPAGYADVGYLDTSDHTSGPGTFSSATFPMTTSYTTNGTTVNLKATSDFELDLTAIAGAGDCVLSVSELSAPQNKLVRDLTTQTTISYP